MQDIKHIWIAQLQAQLYEPLIHSFVDKVSSLYAHLHIADIAVPQLAH
jgi:hypothetical protein